jgi:hypothetical protein
MNDTNGTAAGSESQYRSTLDSVSRSIRASDGLEVALGRRREPLKEHLERADGPRARA